jgi:hypothetical protein
MYLLHPHYQHTRNTWDRLEDNIKVDIREIVRLWAGFVWFMIGTDAEAGCCERGNEPSGYCATELVS